MWVPVLLQIFFFVSVYPSTEIVVKVDDDYKRGVDSTPYHSSTYPTGLLAPGEEVIFWFTIPGDGPYAINKDDTLNLLGNVYGMPDDVNFNVRLRKGDANFDDRDSNLKKKTWGVYESRRLYTCDVEVSKRYYVQVENPATNTQNASLSLSMNVDNDDSCKSLDELGDFFGEIALIVLFVILGVCGIVAFLVTMCFCCICGYQNNQRSAAQGVVRGPAAAGPHPYYNQESVQQQEQPARAPDAEEPYRGNPPAVNDTSEAMDNPLIPAYARPPVVSGANENV